MKKIYTFLLCFFCSFVFAETTKKHNSPFLWIVEKEGKKSYFLGTIHLVVSLEELPCSEQIINQIQNSDLLFIETKAKEDLEKLSIKEQEKLFTGSREEREGIMSRLSPESQEKVKQRIKIMEKFLITNMSVHYYSTASESFSELSPESQQFLTKHGVDPKGSHADFLRFITLINYSKLYFSFPSLDTQVKQTALHHSIETKGLDDSKKINLDIQSSDISAKPQVLVTHNDIEDVIKRIDIIRERMKRNILRETLLYRTYDVNFFIKHGKKIKNEKVFLKDRNELWLKKFMQERDKYNQIFLAVGLQHLIGNYNILGLLKKEGFHIERMTCDK